MSKRKVISMDSIADAAANPIEPIKKLEAQAQGKAPSRMGKVQIGVHVDPDTRAHLKVVAAHTGRSVADLMEEGIQLVLAKHGK
jgi:hypothetical protein